MITNTRLKVVAVSDIHFFHKRTKSRKMLSDLRRLFPMEQPTDIDILICSGDYFDQLVSFNEPDIRYAMDGARHLLRYCKKWGIEFRVLEGTNSHDRRQNQIFEFINEDEGIGAALKYVDTLSIEYLDKWDINILYLPDEWTHNAELTFKQVTDLIYSRGLTKVDLAIVHGGCTYQLPGISSPALHDAAKWSELVTLNILSGHIHEHSRYLKWISVGSMSRLGHGEEGPKGIISLVYLNGKEIEFKRIINHHAKIYRTLSVMGYDYPEIFDLIDQQTDLVDGSAIRLEFSADDNASVYMNLLRETFPQYELSEIRRGKKTIAVTGSAFSQKRFEFTAITPSSTPALLKQRWQEKGISEELIDYTLLELNQLINED